MKLVATPQTVVLHEQPITAMFAIPTVTDLLTKLARR